MSNITSLEETLLQYLQSTKKPMSLSVIVEAAETHQFGQPRIDPIDPVDLKLAALRLVDRGHAELNQRWEFIVASAAG
jgi:hypothetical protein